VTLALEYRPQRFTELAGQSASAAVLYRMASLRTVPSALLFCGAHGCGKTSAARVLGAALNCHEPPGPAASWPCGTCPSCKAVAAGTSLDVTEIDAASNGTVESIRAVREEAYYGTAGEYRLFLLDEAHSMSNAAFNTLLKVMEEPPPQVIFVLLTTEPGRILRTVASRCMTFTFPPFRPSVIRDRLAYICADKGLQPGPGLLEAIAERAAGHMRDAVMMLEQVTSVGITDVARWRVLLGDADFAPALIAAAARGDFPGMFRQLDDAVAATGDYDRIVAQLVGCMRDVLVLSAGGTVRHQGRALEERAALAARVRPHEAVAAMRVLWDLQTRIRKQDIAAGLEASCALLSDALCPVRKEAAPVPAVNAPASIDQLRAIAGDLS
jgi:DNA polymerase III subunit gamma/tau